MRIRPFFPSLEMMVQFNNCNPIFLQTWKDCRSRFRKNKVNLVEALNYIRSENPVDTKSLLSKAEKMKTNEEKLSLRKSVWNSVVECLPEIVISNVSIFCPAKLLIFYALNLELRIAIVLHSFRSTIVLLFYQTTKIPIMNAACQTIVILLKILFCQMRLVLGFIKWLVSSG